MGIFDSKEREIVDEFFKILKEQNEGHLPIYDQVKHAAFKFFDKMNLNKDHTESLVSQVLYKVNDYEMAAHNLLIAYDYNYKAVRNEPLFSTSVIDMDKEMKTYARRRDIIRELHRKYFQ